MELLQLRYFCHAAETENFSATAKAFSVPPSDISQSIRRLERELGCTLFYRKANRVSLNERGRAFFEKARTALAILAEGERAVKEDEERGEISLLINTNRRIVMRAVERFKKQHPEVSFKTLFMGDPSSAPFDVVISTEEKGLSHYEKKHFLTEEIGLAVAADSVPPDRVPCLEEMKEAPFITGSENSTLYPMTVALCERAGFTPHIAMQSNDPYYIRKCVELGLGVALVPTLSWRGQFSDRIRIFPIKGAGRTSFLYHPETKYLPCRVLRFLEVLEEEKEKEAL